MDTFISLHQQEAEALLETLCRIPAPSNREEKRIAFIQDWFLRHGGESHVDGSGNVICRLGHRNTGFVVFSAHMDIVNNSEEELPLKKDGAIWRCPGIGDDTANVVTMLMAYLYAKEHEEAFSTDLLFVADSGEEALGNLKGVRGFFKTYGNEVKAYYSFDFHYPNVYPIPVGSHRYKVTVSTKGGHSYTDFGSPNAILEASLLIASFARIPTSVEPKTTWNVGTIQGGTTVNSIPASCTFTYEYRSTEESELQRMKKAFEETVRKAEREGVSISVSNIGERPAMGDMDREALSAFTEKTAAVVRRATGLEPIITSLSSDSNIPLSRGILANTVGTIVGDGAHTAEEWIDITSLPKGLGIALGLVSLYLL